jgi:hypothetical protein
MTIDLRRTRDIYLWTSGEIALEENGNGEAETPEGKTLEVSKKIMIV